MTNTLVIDVTDAEFEIERRALGGVSKGHTVPKTPQATACFGMTGPQLAAIAGTAKAKVAKVRKQAPKAKPARKVDPHTALRKQAWDWRNAEFHAGRKVTVDEAYAKFGTHRAK